MNFEYNKNQKLRDSMLNLRTDIPAFSDIQYFNNLDANTLQILIDLRFANPHEIQNEAPSIQEFLEWMKENPDYKAHGYAVSLARDDYRVSIEGVDGCAKTPQALKNFIAMFRYADEFDIEDDYQRAWYD